MSVYRHRVYIYPEGRDAACRVGEFPLWWRPAAFFEAYGGRRFEIETLVDLNYALLLTGWEARAWDAQCRAALADDAARSKPFVAEAMHRWEEQLADAHWVIVESYEWESGLD